MTTSTSTPRLSSRLTVLGEHKLLCFPGFQPLDQLSELGVASRTVFSSSLELNSCHRVLPRLPAHCAFAYFSVLT